MINTSTGLRLREIKHKITYKDIEPRMKAALWQYKHCRQKKPSSHIKNETEALRKYWGCYPLHYFRYGLYKSDKTLSMDELTDYIPEFFFYELFLPYYDKDKYSILLKDKNVMEQIFSSAGITQPLLLGKIIKGEIYKNDFKKCSRDEFFNDINQMKYSRIFMKPSEGEGGYGIKVFHKTLDKYAAGGRNIKDYLNDSTDKKDYIIQAGIVQHPEISAIYPNSVNTFRVITENINGKARIVCAVLRIGKEGKEVDNACQDGIILGIDQSSGICNDYASTERGVIFYAHPDTKFVFREHKFSEWDKIKDFALECAEKLPQFTYLGWDIALTTEGPLAIETNMGFGLDLLQAALGGLRKEFGINEPDKYWNCRRGSIE